MVSRNFGSVSVARAELCFLIFPAYECIVSAGWQNRRFICDTCETWMLDNDWPGVQWYVFRYGPRWIRSVRTEERIETRLFWGKYNIFPRYIHLSSLCTPKAKTPLHMYLMWETCGVSGDILRLVFFIFVVWILISAIPGYPFDNSQKALLGQCYNAFRREARDTLVQRNELSTYFVDSLRWKSHRQYYLSFQISTAPPHTFNSNFLPFPHNSNPNSLLTTTLWVSLQQRISRHLVTEHHR